MDPALKIPASPAIKTCNLSKNFHFSPRKVKQKKTVESITGRVETNQWWICPNQHPPVVCSVHANWLRCLNLAFGKMVAAIIWSFWEMRTRDNLAKYAAGGIFWGRGRGWQLLEMASGRDHLWRVPLPAKCVWRGINIPQNVSEAISGQPPPPTYIQKCVWQGKDSLAVSLSEKLKGWNTWDYEEEDPIRPQKFKMIFTEISKIT